MQRETNLNWIGDARGRRLGVSLQWVSLGFLHLCAPAVPSNEVKMLPVTADNIFWPADVSSSLVVRAVLGGIVSCNVVVSDTPSPSANGILSWSWPCVCIVAILMRSTSSSSYLSWLHCAQWREMLDAFVSSTEDGSLMMAVGAVDKQDASSRERIEEDRRGRGERFG